MTETSPRRHRDKTETSPNTETSPKPDRDKTETSPRQDRDMTETSPRQDRDILGEFLSGAWAAPGRLIHVRPKAYRYWGKTVCSVSRTNSEPQKIHGMIRLRTDLRVRQVDAHGLIHGIQNLDSWDMGV